MKKILSILFSVPMILTGCLAGSDPVDSPDKPDVSDPVVPDEPTTPDPVVPDEPTTPDNPVTPDPVVPDPIIPDNPVTPAPPNSKPVFGKTKVTLGVHSDLSNLDWISLLNITDDTSTASEIVVEDYGIDFVYGVENVVTTLFNAKDKEGLISSEFIEITFEGLGLSDDQIFSAANRMSFQIHTHDGTSGAYGSGYALSMDHTTNDMYVMTNMHVVDPQIQKVLLRHDYQKTGTYLPDLCAEHDFTLPSRHNASHWFDLSILKVIGQSTDGTINGCNNPSPYVIDTSLVEFPNLLQIDAMNSNDYYGYTIDPNFDSKDINLYLSGFPAGGWNGTDYDGVSTVPTLINRKERLENTIYHSPSNATYNTYVPKWALPESGRTYQNNAIYLTGKNVTGGASGSIIIDRNLNVVGTLNANLGGDVVAMVVADDMKYFINKYCEDASRSKIEMCK